MATKRDKILAVFDFDDTLIDCESDVWIVKLCTGGRAPDWMWEKRRKRHYMEFLEHFLQYLHDNGVTPMDILDFMASVPYTEGMEAALKLIGKNSNKFDCMVVSGANVMFIEATLKAHNVEQAVNKIYSNHGRVDDEGRMHVWAYHKHQCTICTADICKGALLSEYVKEQAQKGVTYTKVVYVGDGVNDLCPCKGLGPSDVVMPRKGYKLIEKIEETTPQNIS
ncbi:pyridoxal phosphate phosphatase PHOSPHO2-like [Branchiostoma floridae]|uniref:Pyridoxal phosphate phosphatase PHOSPHO2-like n=1 Tax=Branchiostoma floridae TaxID=7739 RepID=A0A9J7LX20_BRAFL|nr:pyridoxal phosphate phosphatase PHOSPHO2-like [Branchiostoma floridae]